MPPKGDSDDHGRAQRRLKQQRRRAREANVHRDLEHQVYVLQQLITHYKPRSKTILPWTQVASALHDAADDALMTNAALLTQREQLQRLGHCLASWAAAVNRRYNVPAASEPFAWQHVLLPTDPIARRTSIDWFSQRLFHNTDRMLAHASFPSSSLRVMDHVEIDCGDDLLDITARLQVDIALPLEAAYSALRNTIWSILRGDNEPRPLSFMDSEALQAIDTNLFLMQLGTADNVDHFVGREFHGPNRVVFISGNIFSRLHDRSMPWRPRLFWHTLDRLGPTTTRLRVLFYNAPCIGAGGRRTSWQEEFRHAQSMLALEPQADEWAAYQRYMDGFHATMLQQYSQRLGLHLLPTV
ncbi:hypothetical protein SDRG_16627 [Saprolegnia diclina VS20]|uniref:Uncharacterized protein n=1 Tax=Saprolegnia diclina (strain VS20) TaxID=1156394 RepID=T0R0L1_SAPDV|nr:hypothetical protein SDRG_16627 [Saprolegnia diclina VS20]EQC25503.1 hypothetical protein SDRG_16627 [Saprolegnia diclina VS20]|eukprot:XP_008621067.1 hypothetical protein SDRG_16627 [Saprolegnia diclina VS20]